MIRLLNFLAERIFKIHISTSGSHTSNTRQLRAWNRLLAENFDELFILSLPKKQQGKAMENLANSKSQYRQDILALLISDFEQNGYFVEFGATDGLYLSNTYLLEKHYHWSGIIAEPAKVWHEKLAKNRDCRISHSCVWKTSGKNIFFSETANAELSTVTSYREVDNHSTNRQASSDYEVETITLHQLLKDNNAPKIIDYLSVDTEGTEFDIMKSFPFHEYQFNFISIEHNFGPQRVALQQLFRQNGYVEILPHLSSCDFWFTSRELASRFA